MYDTKMLILLLVALISIFFLNNGNLIYGQQNIHNHETVTDYDGNVYQTIIIGNQIWMAENLRSTHYSDGALIQNYVYDNDTANVNIYGRLYRWNAAMRNAASSNSNPSGVQGASPEGWHIPSEAEWLELINFLGGESIAGGKLKEIGFEHWNYPNTGATNEVGFSALPAGWFDFTGEFRGIGETCFFRTSTSPNPYEAYTRELTSNVASITRADIHPDDAIPIRCVKNDTGTSIIDENKSGYAESFQLNQNYPNPFNPATKINFQIAEVSFVTLKIYDVLGSEIETLVNEQKPPGSYEIKFNSSELNSGVYFYKLQAGDYIQTKSMVLMK